MLLLDIILFLLGLSLNFLQLLVKIRQTLFLLLNDLKKGGGKK